MSVLSIRDLYKEIGKNIFIHPLKIDNIKANTINLTASKFAWSVKANDSICNDGKIIKIEPNDTALIYTKEAIYVTRKIGGTYHSKVSLVSKGLGHIGTTLDPEYLGLSLIAVHNHSGKAFELKVGSTFVSLMFHYLKTPTFAVSHNNVPGQIGILQGYDNTSDFENWKNEHDWINEQRKLKKKMRGSNEYNEMKKYLKDIKFEEWKLIYLLFNHRVTKWFIFSVLIVVMMAIYYYFNSVIPIELSVVIVSLFGMFILYEIRDYYK
ncbi:MAG: hypothetical protein Q7J10_02945 [Methanosarcinaceae archaeon]|nr:hypothetical protein [Methanosarcinaceae archaeon]